MVADLGHSFANALFPYPFRTTQLVYRRIHGREDAESQGAIEALHVFKKEIPGVS